MRRHAPWSAMLVLAIGVAATPLLAAPPGQSQAERVAKAYQDAQQYRAESTSAMAQAAPRHGVEETGSTIIAIDRPTNRLLVDAPTYRLVQDGATLRFRHVAIPHAYVETTVQPSLDLVQLTGAVPPIRDEPVIDLTFLLTPQPVAALSGGAAQELFPATGGLKDRHPGEAREFAMREGQMTLWLDPADSLIRHARLEVNPTALPQGTTIGFDWAYDITHLNKPLPDDTFAFDTSGTRVASFQELISAGSGSGTSAGGGRVKAEDFELPSIEDKSVKFSEAQKRVTVLVFYANWLPNAGQIVESTQAIAEWVAAEKLDAAVILVAMGQDVATTQGDFAEQKPAMTVLVDEAMQLAAPYQVNTLPVTSIIADGEVQVVYGTPAADYVEAVQREVRRLHDAPKPENEAPSATPATPETEQTP